MLRFLTAGESHGKGLIGVIEGLPSGLTVSLDFINMQLQRRQLGYGRGERMKIEKDQIEILSGVRHGATLGSPVSFSIQNRDWKKWQSPMSTDPIPKDSNVKAVTRPRPGHGDLAGALKYQTHDIRDVLERASARETAARVAVGAFCRLLLSRFDIPIASHVIAIGREHVDSKFENLPIEKILALDPQSSIRCADTAAETRMKAHIDETKQAGDSLGGIVEVVAASVLPGLGSHVQWNQKLDGQIAQAMMSIPSVKAVEIGSATAAARSLGSEVHDPISYDKRKKAFYRKTNRAGGLEGGISNGSDIRVRIYMKPIPTLTKPLPSVDVLSKESSDAAVERSDTCVVPAGGVIAEAMLGFVLAKAFIDKFGGDSMAELEQNHSNYLKLLDKY